VGAYPHFRQRSADKQRTWRLGIEGFAIDLLLP
jgi:hypothetical protein